MPVTYTIIKDMGLVVSCHRGITDDDEMIAAYTAMYADSDFDLAFYKLIDLREADSRGRDSQALRSLAERTRSHYTRTDTKSKVAIIAPGDLSFGLGRMYNSFTDENAEDVAVFRSTTEACNWLEIDPCILDRD